MPADFQTAVNEGDKLTLPSARDAVLASKALLTNAMDFVKGVINKTEPRAPLPGNATGPQRSVEINSKKLPIHFEDAVNVLRSLRQDSPSMDGRLSQDDVEKIVQRAHRLCSWKYLIQEQHGEEDQNARSLLSRDTHRDGGLTKPHPRKGKNRNKQEDFCRDCGSKKQNCGDQSCENPPYMTIRIRERREKSEYRPHLEPEKKMMKEDPPRECVSERHREQKSPTAGHGAVSDINPLSMDPNPILNTGCPRKVGGILVGNAIASKCQILNDVSVIIVPEGTQGLSDKRLFLPTYLYDDNLTHVLLVPTQSKCFPLVFLIFFVLFCAYFSRIWSLLSSI